MNKNKRMRLKEACTLLEQVLKTVGSIKDEEQDCADNVPENLMDGAQYSAMEDAIDELEEAIDCINQASEHIYKACF